jgi:hypothetical protein
MPRSAHASDNLGPACTSVVISWETGMESRNLTKTMPLDEVSKYWPVD